MALDLRGVTKFPETRVLTINNSTVIEIQLPISAKWISLSSEDGDIKVYWIDGLSDGDTPSGTDGYQFVKNDNLLEQRLTSGSGRRSSCYVMFKTTASGTLHINLEG